MNGTDENKVDSLIAELRSFGDRPPPRFAWKRLADELESAVKEERDALREAATSKMLEGATIIDNRGQGNTAAMREALTNLTCFEESDIRQLEQLAKRAIDNDICGGGILQALCGAIREGKAALAAPPRQFDVGKPEEQLSRWGVYCKEGKARCLVQGKWRFINCTACFADWAQMPYEEECL